MKNENMNQEQSYKLKEYLNKLLEENNDNSFKKEEQKKLIEEMNLKIEKEMKNVKNIKHVLNKKDFQIIGEDNICLNNKIKQISVNNVEIPEGTHTWRNQKLPQIGAIFTDKLFPPIKKSLCKINVLGKWEFPDDLEESDLKNWEYIKWERVEDIFMSSNYQVFYDKIEKDDIIQGSLGNCYFLSALASLSRYPNLIEKLFFFKEKSDEHCYGCYFRINGVWKLVLLDDFIPCYNNGYENNFAFSYTNGYELWVILLEKAWAKLNGNYARIIGGDPHEIFEILTNAYSEKFMFNNYTEEEIWLKYKDAQEKGFLMTAGTNCDEDLLIEEMGLIKSHAYTIIQLVEVTTKLGKQKLINLRNPWGHREWIGDWSDSSEKWTKDIRDQCLNYGVKDDGSFWMSLEDFYKYYIIGGICHLYQDYHYSFLHVFKETSVKGAFLSKLIINENNTHCFLMIHQKNPRVILRNGQYQEPVLFYLIILDSNFEYISSAYGQEKNINIEINLNKGIYYLISDINYRFIQKEQHGYTLSCYSSIPVEICIEKKVNTQNAFKTCLFSYSKKIIIPKKNKGGLIYKIKKKNKDFPFSFILFDNSNGENEILISDLIKITGKKNVSYYFEGEKDNDLFISKTILPGQWDIFCIMPYKLGISYSIQLKTFYKEQNKYNLRNKFDIPFIQQMKMKDDLDLFKKTFDEEFEYIDDKGYIRQYIYCNCLGYYIGIENVSNEKKKIRLKLKYISLFQRQNISFIDFDIGPQEKKLFLLNYKNYLNGEISFNFEIF